MTIIRKIKTYLLVAILLILTCFEANELFSIDYNYRDQDPKYELFTPYVTYFGDGKYQIVGDVPTAYSYALIEIEKEDNANENQILAYDIERYLLIKNELYLVGKVWPQESEDKYFVLNLKSGEEKSYLTLDEVPYELRENFTGKIPYQCRRNKSCFEDR